MGNQLNFILSGTNNEDCSQYAICEQETPLCYTDPSDSVCKPVACNSFKMEGYIYDNGFVPAGCSLQVSTQNTDVTAGIQSAGVAILNNFLTNLPVILTVVIVIVIFSFAWNWIIRQFNR